MLQTLLHFRNPDSTLDLNNQLAQFFQQGLISGGEVSPVGGILAVNVNPFKLIGIDGMVVLEDVNVQQLAVFANQTNYVVFLSKYIPNGPAIAEYQVLSASAYNSSPDKDHMTVFCTVTLPLGATQVLATQISYAERSELDAVGRNIIRGVLTDSANLPTANNRAGDLYVVTSTTLAPAIWSWSGTAWLNITDTLDIASILSKHRNNLYPNEIHLTDQQAIAATGTYGTPGVESLGVSINIPTSTFFLSEPISTDNLTTGDVIQFSTTGTLPSGINNTSTYYVIVMTQTQFQVATTLDNALASIAIQLLGTQSGTQTATFAENKYVTSTDPRLIPFESAGALDGLAGRPFVFGVPSIPPPSSTNPFVTGAYTFASPDSTLLTSGVGPFTLSTGPFYVGTGNAASVYQYFKLYVNGSPREFVDPITGLVSNTVGVFKDNLLTQPLIPSSDPSVIASNGFYNGTLYLTVSPGLTSPALVRYANEKTLLNINPAAFENVDYFSAQSTQEMILKTQAISGRVFDQGIPPDETNLQLRVDLNTETQFNIASTAGFMTVHPSQFERLSQTDFGANFPVQIDQTVLYAGSPYTIDYSVSNFVAFGLSSADVGPTASIIYASGPNLTSIPLGSFFIDSAGTRWRMLNSGIVGSVLIYTGGETIAPYSAGGPYTAPGQIVAGNNPRELQLTNSHRVWQGTQTIPITGVDFLAQNETEMLPPGGNANGIGSQASTFIGQAILNNNGTNNQFYATGTGRPIYNVLPKRDQNFYDERIVLIGSWDNNASGPWVEGSPAINSSGGTNSASPCGIEITGYLREVSLVTHMSVAQASAFTFYVFVDGSYRMAVQPTSDGITPNGTPFEVIRFPLNLPLGVHTVRIEIAGSSTSPFQLSSVQLFSTALNSILIDDAKDLANTDLLSVASVTKTLNNGLALSGLPFKGVWYVTPAGVVSLAYQTQKYYRWLSPALTAGGVLTVPSNVPNVQSGDVVRYENTALQYQNLQVTQGYQGAASVQLGNVTAPGSGASLSYLFRIPITSNASGTPVLGAAASPLDIEYTNLLFEDWDTGDANDITSASVGLQTSLVTVLNDGITTLAVTNCTRVNTNIAGYKDGLSLSSTTSEMNIQGYGTRMDVVFAGLSGPSTVSIMVDGQFTYTITINGTGGPERHTIFYNAPQQVHTARIFNPNIANTVVVAEWTFYDLEDPEYNGVPISQYSIPLPTSNLFGSDGSVGPTTIPVQYNSAGVVVRDVTRFGTFHSASAGWSLIQDFTVNSRFGYYATTTTNLDYFTFDFIGTMFELYILDTGTPGTLKFEAISSTNPVWLDLNGTNFSGFNSPAGQINTTTGIYPMGATDNLIRVVGYSMPSDRYTVRVTLPLQTVTNAQLSVLAFGENAPTYQIQKYNEQTLDPSALYMSAEQDVRNFLTLLPDQGGAVGVEGGTGTGVTVVSAPEEVADLTPAGGYQAMMSNGFFSSPTDPNGQVDLSRTNATWNPAKYLFNIHAQQSVSVTVTGTSFVIGTTITGFTVKVGDIIFRYPNPLNPSDPAYNIFRTIVTVTGAIGTLDAAFPSNFTNGSCMVSQAVWTKELVTLGDPASGNQPVEMFPNTSITVINTSYQDSVGSGNDIPDMTAQPVVAMSASNAGLSASPTTPLSSTFTTLYKRPVAPNMIPDYILASNANNQLLSVVYFVVPTAGGNTNVNLIRYDISFYQLNTIANGGVLSSAYAYNSGIANGYFPVNSFNPTNVLGLTQWQMEVPYIMNVNAGTADGDLSVQFNGQTVPRFVGSGAMPATELYYTEINNYTIGFSQDIITGQPTMAIQGVRRQGVNDGSVVNSNRINALANIMVGTTSDVANGTAQYSSLQSAVTAAGTGAVIVVLTGVSITENVTISKRVNISGVGGYDSFINGTVTCEVGCSFTQISGIRVTQFILNSGANGNIINSCFWSTDYFDSGTGNSISGVNIT